MIASYADLLEEWSHIRERDCPIVIEHRQAPLGARDIGRLLDEAPFTRRAEGGLADVGAALVDLPEALAEDVADLTARFMTLMQVNAVRVRLEGITTNACWKVHADHTDVRLITTYAGPGTDYAPHGTDPDGDTCCLERVPTGAVALFKGRTFADDHAPCFHRSPPVGDSGERRLVVVIDTPLQVQV